MKLEKSVQNNKENRNITAKKINNNLLMEILYFFNPFTLDNQKTYDYKTIQIIIKLMEDLKIFFFIYC